MFFQDYQFHFNNFRNVTVTAPDFPSTPMPGQQTGPNAPPRSSIAGSHKSFDDDDAIPRNLLNSSNYRNQNC